MGTGKFLNIHKKYGEILKQKVEKDKTHYEKYEAREKRRTKRRQRRALRDSEDLKPLLSALKEKGIEIEHPSQLLEGKIAYEKGVPALIVNYSKIRDRSTRKSILDALGVKKILSTTWIEMVRVCEAGKSVGDLPYQLAHKSIYDALVRLSKLECDSKISIINAFGKIKNPEASEILVGFLNDPALQLSAIKALGIIRAIPARRHLEKFIFNQEDKIQHEAVKAITKIDRFIEKSKWSS